LVLVLAALSVAGAAPADVPDFLAGHSLEAVFPGAERLGAPEGNPPAAPVYKNDHLAGYVFHTSDVVESFGFSRKPIRLLVGLDLSARVTGVAIIEHQEPILVLGIPDQQLDEFLEQYRGIDIRQQVRLSPVPEASMIGIDRVSGATITSLVFNDAVVRAARLIARPRGLFEPGGPPRPSLDAEVFAKATWRGLLGDGSMGRMTVSNGQVDRVFEGKAGKARADDGVERDPDKVFIDLFVALATPSGIGQNLLGFAAYASLMAELEAGAQVLFVAANGAYSFKGYTYRQSGVFDRIQLLQGSSTLRLKKDMFRPVRTLDPKDAPEVREAGLFVVPPGQAFDPTAPWRIEILVERTIPPGGPIFAVLPLDYEVPGRFIAAPAAKTAQNGQQPLAGVGGEPALWVQSWSDGLIHIVVLSLGLLQLLLVLFFQDTVVRHKKFNTGFRIWFLCYTLFYMGWMIGAQLSVVNVVTFVNALRTDFSWEFFLLEPPTFILWSFVAVALIFWGRGVFCGWLCPFGALQELINRVALALRVPQVSVPFPLNERLWALKYVVFMGLFAPSLGPEYLIDMALEVEPFKTAITLKFVRMWPFVLYAVVLLVASVFVQRIFCRYLCPLGAALAIPARNRMFEWLKRRKECGAECHICSELCPVQAIHPEGQINPHECIYCLDCQAVYFDDKLCPPLVKRRKRIEQRVESRKRREQQAPLTAEHQS
jgi:NosR/NirI family transcriptional regulator, nitrous oxide reductase regulator